MTNNVCGWTRVEVTEDLDAEDRVLFLTEDPGDEESGEDNPHRAPPPHKRHGPRWEPS